MKIFEKTMMNTLVGGSASTNADTTEHMSTNHKIKTKIRAPVNKSSAPKPRQKALEIVQKYLITPKKAAFVVNKIYVDEFGIYPEGYETIDEKREQEVMDNSNIAKRERVEYFIENHLSANAKRLLNEENAGGASEFSEAISFQYLQNVYGAKLEKTEMEIQYYGPGWKKTDYEMSVGKNHIAVSVTRALNYYTRLHRERKINKFNSETAAKLLSKKLYGVHKSNEGVCVPFGAKQWDTQILHIFAETMEIANLLEEAWISIVRQSKQDADKGVKYDSLELIGKTLVMVTVPGEANEITHALFHQKTKFTKCTKRQRA